MRELVAARVAVASKVGPGSSAGGLGSTNLSGELVPLAAAEVAAAVEVETTAFEVETEEEVAAFEV